MAYYISVLPACLVGYLGSTTISTLRVYPVENYPAPTGFGLFAKQRIAREKMAIIVVVARTIECADFARQ